MALLAGWVAVSPSAAQTNAGDVSKIGGQGPDANCLDENLANRGTWGDDGTAPLGSAKFNFNSFANIHSIAVDAGRTNVFVPDGTVVRGLSGPVAGVARGDPLPSSTSSTVKGTPRGLAGAAAEGANPRAVALRPLAVAVDANANNLYVLEPDAVRRVTLRGTPAINTIAGLGVGTAISAGAGSGVAADKFGRVFIADANSGALYRLEPASQSPVRLGTLASGSITVDAGGTALYGITGADKGNTVSRIDPVSGTMSVVAGGGTTTTDGVAATSAALKPTALAVDPLGGFLYIADASGRIRIVDLRTGVINSVVGSGQRGYQSSGKAASFTMNTVNALAVDLFGNVYMLVPDDCALFLAVTPAVIFTPSPPTEPPAPQPPPSTPPGPTGHESSNSGGQSAPQTVTGGNQGAASQQGGAPGSQQVPGDQGAVVNQPQTELRVIDQGNVLTTPQQVAQPTVNPVSTPAPAAQFSPTPTPTPASDAGTVTLVDPGTSHAAAVADPSTAVPAAPAPAPVPPPPAPASAPPPAAQQPVSNVGLVGLVHGDSPAPARGATRYAMVRNDDEQSVAGLAMAGAGALVAMFLCVLFVAPGASSKPKPRPKGAY